LRKITRLVLVAALVAVVAAAALVGPRALTTRIGDDTTGSKRDSDQLIQKVASISAFGARPSKQTRRTAVSERELNAYLSYEAAPQLPVGVVDPSVAILGNGQLSGRAVVDLDEVRKSKNPTSLLDPTSYMTGRLPVTATGTLSTSQGTGHFNLQSATLGGIPIPKRVLQEIVSYYSRSPERPGGLSLGDSFQLPSRIREILVERGQATIVQ